MIWQLMRYDRANVPVTFIALSVALVFAIAPDVGMWMNLPILMLIPLMPWHRISSFEMVIPIHGRTVLAARLLTRLLLLSIPFAVWQISSVIRHSPPKPTVPIWAVFAIVAMYLLVPYLVQPRGAEAPAKRRLILPWLAVIAAGAFTIYALPAMVAVAVLLIATSAATFVTLRQAPESYVTMAPVQSVAKARGINEVSGSQSYWWWPVVRELMSPNVLFMLAVLLFVGYLSINTYMMLAILMAGISLNFHRHTRWLRTLPFSRRAHTLFLVFVTALAPVCSLTLGSLGTIAFPGLRAMGVGAPTASNDYNQYEIRTKVPFANWQRLSVASPATIVSPWGESSPVYTVHVFGSTYFNPFSTVEESSDAFIEWQFARATTAVYEQNISRDTYESNRRDLPPRTTQSPSMRVLWIGVLLSFALFFVWISEHAYSHVVARNHVMRRVAPWLTLVPLVSILVTDMTYSNTVPYTTNAITEYWLLRLSQWLPSNLLIVSVVAALPVAMMYFVVEWQVGRSELPVGPVQK